MAGNRPEEHVARPAVRQSWRQMTFLHWRVDAGAVEALLPRGLVPDVLDGSAWVGLTPFRVEGFRVLDAPLPFVSSFPETNVRVYVRHRSGRDGLWFLSLDVTSALNVLGGRAGGLPYFWSAMSIAGEGSVRYRCRRVVGPRAGHDITVRPGPPIPLAEVSALASGLVGRWRAYSRVAGRLLEIRVEHEPWPLRSATIEHLDETLIAPTGLPLLSSEPLVHYSDGVDARLGAPRLLTSDEDGAGTA